MSHFSLSLLLKKIGAWKLIMQEPRSLTELVYSITKKNCESNRICFPIDLFFLYETGGPEREPEPDGDYQTLQELSVAQGSTHNS